ncbi:MAG: hypothetical protein LBU34_05225 [Planctomycetaceae bacterium]|jgi:predicted small lipoprotein YifL|nr:hypothetical protein [Planctomycetaceae bacterium]
MTRIFITIVSLSCFCGCGEKQPDGFPPLHSVTISIKENAVPLENVNVAFYNEDGSIPQWSIGGVTDAKGITQLKTYGKYDGVPEGIYKVVLSKQERKNAPEAPAPGSLREEFDVYEEQMIKYPAIESIPKEYTSANTTTLTVTVTQKTVADFDIGKQ